MRTNGLTPLGYAFRPITRMAAILGIVGLLAHREANVSAFLRVFWPQLGMRCLPLALSACLLSACTGMVGEPAGPPTGPGPGGGPAVIPCGDTGQAITLLENRCALPVCHGGPQFPRLDRAGLAELPMLESQSNPGEPLLVMGDPESSWLYKKMIGAQGASGGALMPLGVAMPIDEASIIETWIRDGASTSCDELPPPLPTYDPNALDPTALFTCADPSAPRSSPSRLRRIEREELTHAAFRSLNGSWWGSTMRDNPFTVPEGALYSTYTNEVGIDTATLDLYTLNLDEAAVTWSKPDPVSLTPPGVRVQGVYNSAPLACMTNDANPDPDCIDSYVDLILTRGTLFRTPTDGERSRLRDFINSQLAAEPDISARQATLHQVARGAFLMAGTLFRSELGDDSGALTDEELALALGHVLSTHPTGAPIATGGPGPDDPDAADPSLGRLGAIRAAADDGSIQDPAVRRALLRQYGSGVAQSRPDISFDSDDRRLAVRGEYWLAPGFARFFREWLDYGSANAVFKDHPGATSRWDGTYTGDPMWDPTTTGFGNLQSGYYGYESKLVEQLDDTIARAVIESDASGQDVFEALLTTRMWRLPSDLAQVNGMSCAADADCTDPSYDQCTDIGQCGSSIASTVIHAARVYGVDDIPATPEGRWVMMDPAQRLGVLTHPAWLGAHGVNFEDDASLVHRGKWVREAIFCQTVPPLEFVRVEAMLVPSDPALSARARVERSINENPSADTCMGCHSRMNTLGLPFELFNHAGFVRAQDHGSAPDGSTTVDNLPDASLNRDYASPFEFIDAIAHSHYARRGFIRHAFRYFMGRPETLADACTLVEMEQALDETGSFFAMMEALVSSQTFSRRHLEEVAP